MRHSFAAVSLVVLALLGCDRIQPLEPAFQAAGAAGPKVTAPSNTNAVAVSASGIDVSWQDNSSNETGFEVHRSAAASASFALLASTGTGVTRYIDAGLAPSTRYCYKVRAFRMVDGKTGYSEFSNTACVTTTSPPPPPPPPPPPASVPAAPGGQDAKPGNSSSVTVGWIDNSTNEDGFRVERSLDGGSTWITARSTNANATFSTDDGRTSEQQVCYRVIAYNGQGDSPPSNTDCTTPPAAPSDLIVAATGSMGEINNLAWVDNSGVEDGYEVQQFSCTWDLSCGFWTIAILGPNATSFSEEVLWGNTYIYRVVARKDGGRSDPSNEATIYGQ